MTGRVRFEWDEDKNLANQRKHGIVFTELDGNLVRIISARSATQREKQMFLRYPGGPLRPISLNSQTMTSRELFPRVCESV